MKLKIKLFNPPRSYSITKDFIYIIYPFGTLPYGMGVITAALRQNGYYVEQDELVYFSALNQGATGY